MTETASQTARILKLLQTEHGVTNHQLNRIAFRYSARIADLRNEGWDILSIHEKGSLWRFVLKGRKDLGDKK